MALESAIDSLRRSAAAITSVADAQAPQIAATVDVMVEAFRADHKLLVCGNGGSAAQAQHFVAELVGRFYLRERTALPAIAITADASILTALGNDYGFDRIFARQVEALGRPGDVLIGLSTSGRSPNVLAAFAIAKERGMATVSFVGGKSDSVLDNCDVVVRAPSMETPYIQDAHGALIHAVCEQVETIMFGQVA